MRCERLSVNLTIPRIVKIVRCMWRKLVAALLILGWISLSGFDLVEDLDEIPGQAAISQGSPDAGSVPKRGGWGPLANNIVESAYYSERNDVAPVSFTPTIIESDWLLDFRRHSQLHKLHRVFLI